MNDAPAMGDDCPEHLSHNIGFRKATAVIPPVPCRSTFSSGGMLLPQLDPAAFIKLKALRLDSGRTA